MAPQLTNAVRNLVLYWHFVRQLSIEEIAELAHCSVRMVYNIIEHFEETGNTHALPQGHCPQEFSSKDLQYCLSLL